MKRSIPLLVVLGAIFLAGAGPATTQPVAVSNIIEATATVESVDMTTRQVLLSGPNGELDTIVAGPEVRNLAQVHPGDHVVVRARESIAVAMSKPGSTAVTAAGTFSGRAMPGAKPAGAEGGWFHARVTITAIDPAHNTVSFVGPARILRVVHVVNPEIQAFVNSLKVGDDVDVTYAAAVAIAVTPAT